MQRSFLNPIEDVNGSDKMNVVKRALNSASMDRLSTQRKNYLCVCKMCVKSIVDKSPFEVILDDCPFLNNLCTILEHIFIHRMQVRWSIFGVNQDSAGFWHMFQTFAHPNTVKSIEDMENISSDIGKCRVWLRLSLVQKRLSSFMNSLLSKQCDLKNMYMQGAFLLSPELVELAGTLQCLDAIDFNLCLKDVTSFDNAEIQEINFSPYLKFKQSDISQMDDLQEEHKLSNSQPMRGSSGKGEAVRDKPTIEEESISQLVELLKTEKEQKNYFEELVSVRDSQVAKLQKDVDSLTKENEEQRKEMDSLVIELQQKISSLQSELQQVKLSRSNSTSSNRRSGLFSGIFGANAT